MIKIEEQKKIYIWILVFTIIIGFTINNSIPYKGDESYYLISGMNMIKNNNILIPHHYWKVRFEKPILTYWFVILGFKIFGINFWSARIFFLLISILLLYLIYKFSLLIKNDCKFGLFNVILLCSSTMYIMFSRFAMTDLLLTFFITLCLFLFFKSLKEIRFLKKNYLFAYICMGFGFNTKGFLAFLPILAMGIYLVIYKPSQYKKYLINLINPINIIILLIISSPWYVYVFIKYHDTFIRQMKGEAEGKADWSVFLIMKRIFFYLITVFRYFFPITIIAFYYKLRNRTKFNNEFKIMLVFCVVMILFFALFVNMQRSRYLLPIMPIISILTGVVLFNNKSRNIILKIAIGVFLIHAIVLISLPIIRGNPMKELSEYWKENCNGEISSYYIDFKNLTSLDIYLKGVRSEKWKEVPFLIVKSDRYKDLIGYTVIKNSKSLKKVKFKKGKLQKTYEEYYLIKRSGKIL